MAHPSADIVAAPRPARLGGVQALRGIAATAVVLCHAARHVDKIFGAPLLIRLFQAGHAGVDLFFVISGFIILFVHRRDIGDKHRLGHYAGRRFNRVMPLYWIALALTIAMSIAGGHPIPSAARILWSASLLPSSGEPLLGIAWTLQFELVFYAVFATLILSRFAGIAVFLAWFLLIALRSGLHGLPRLPSPLCGPYCFEFFMGMAAAFLVTQDRLPAARAVGALGAIAFGSALVLESAGVLDGFGTGARFVYGGAAFLLVAGVAAAERRGTCTLPRWLQLPGEASYSIYLFQFVFIGLVWQAWLKAGLARTDTALACFVALACAAVGGGILVSRVIEHRLLRLTRRQNRLRLAS